MFECVMMMSNTPTFVSVPQCQLSAHFLQRRINGEICDHQYFSCAGKLYANRCRPLSAVTNL